MHGQDLYQERNEQVELREMEGLHCRDVVQVFRSCG